MLSLKWTIGLYVAAIETSLKEAQARNQFILNHSQRSVKAFNFSNNGGSQVFKDRCANFALKAFL